MTAMPTMTLRSPEDVLAMVPYVLGFLPHDSVVMLTLGADEPFHARVDLPTDVAGVDAVASCLLPTAVAHRVRQVVLVIYSDDTATASLAVRVLAERLGAAGIEVVVAMRADGECYWLFHADKPEGEAEGAPYDVGSHTFTALSVLDGRVTHRSRDELRESLVSSDLEAMEDLDRRCVELAGEVQGEATDIRTPGDTTLAAKARWALRAVVRARRERAPLDAESAARMLVCLVSPQVRDMVWADITRRNADAHVEVWSNLTRRAPLTLRAAPAALLAFAAWLAGDGALAWCAVDRALEADPDYGMAALVVQTLTSAMPPSAWTGIDPSTLPILDDEATSKPSCAPAPLRVVPRQG